MTFVKRPVVKVRLYGVYSETSRIELKQDPQSCVYMVTHIEGKYKSDRIVEGIIFDYRTGIMRCGFTVKESFFFEEIGYCWNKPVGNYRLMLKKEAGK